MAQKLNSQPIQAWRNKTRLLASAVVAVVLVPGLVAHPVAENDLAPPLREYLEKEIRLTKAEIDSVIAGRPVAKLLKTKTKDEVAIFGIVRINSPQELFIEKLRDIVDFESGPAVQGIGLFHSPPVLSDVAALQIDEKELKEIPNCRVGDCSLKLSDRAMQSLREQIDWRSPKATSQAQSMIRQAIVDYVGNYQKIGDEALAVYNDQDKPQAIREGLRRLLQNASHLIQYNPQLVNYLEKYPQERPPDTEDIFYWQKGEFGLKPVVRASHLVIQRNQRENHITYAVASKMLIASHYFRAALEVKSVVPDSPSPDSKSFYLVCLNDSFVDGLTGFKGALIRGTVVQKSRRSLANYLASTKQKMEAAYRGK